MANNKTLQLLRNSSIYASRTTALTNLETQLKAATAKDGEPILARYYTGTQGGDDYKEHTLLGIKSANGYEIFDNEGSASAAVTSVQYNGENNKITYTKNGLAIDVVTLAEVATSGTAADVAVVDSTGVITADNVEGALTEIATEINNMNKTASAENGQVVTTVSESEGVVSETKANVKDLQLGGYSKDTDATGAIGSTDTINTALSKLENKAADITVASADKTVTVTNPAGGGTDLAVNIDGTTLIKNSSTGVISSDLKIKSIAQSAGSTYASQYQLVYGNSETPIGDVISVAKDQFLKEASFNPSTQVLTLVMYNSTGGTTDITVDFKDVVIEAEAGLGLYVGESEPGVSDGTINIGIDANSEAVTISDGQGGSTTAAVLTVGADSIKVDHIQDAIDYAVSTATGALDYTDTAESHKFVTEVDEVNGVIAVQRAQPTAGDIATTAVAADSTHVAIAGTDAATQIDNISVAIKAEETARANAIANLDAEETSTDGTNVQVKVTEVDGVITAVNITTDNTVNATDVSNAIANLDSSVSATAASGNAYSVLTGVTQTDGVLTNKTEVLLAAAAKTGAAADVSVTNSGDYFTATNVEAALAELAVFDAGTY